MIQYRKKSLHLDAEMIWTYMHLVYICSFNIKFKNIDTENLWQHIPLRAEEKHQKMEKCSCQKHKHKMDWILSSGARIQWLHITWKKQADVLLARLSFLLILSATYKNESWMSPLKNVLEPMKFYCTRDVQLHRLHQKYKKWAFEQRCN